MNEHSHRGAKPQGLISNSVDRRVLELDEALRGVEATTGVLPGLGFFRDPTRAAAAALHTLNQPGRFSRGTVIHPLPYVNWFKVQMGDGAGWIAACAGAHGSLSPVGPKDLAMPTANDNVLVFKPKGFPFGVIVCTLPPLIADNTVVCPDWVVQAGGTGLKREKSSQFPITGHSKQGGVLDFSAQRPQDQTPAERGWITATGCAITIDDDMVQMRVNEMCGVWMTVPDSWLRVAGVQLLIESSVHEEESGDDEGESRYFKGIAAYPHEALGLYEHGTDFTQENDDKAVQYDKHKAKVDLPDGSEDLQPIYRYQEYAGYLGQGHLRLVTFPEPDGGKRQYKNETVDTGLFMESIGLDGSVTLLSAKSVHIGKRIIVLAPKAKRLIQDKKGDDGEANNYKFSSLYGGGPNHKVGDVAVDGDVKSVLRVAAVNDLIAYDCTWKAVHPFHYHTADYKTPQPSDMKVRVQGSVNYGQAASDFYVADPTPVPLKIDHRYGQVDYFERESFIRFHDDGSVHLAAGCGAELVLAGGRARLNAPAGIDVCPGGDFSVLASQIVLRAKGSVDVSSSEKDVRLKAEGNMQLLAGNGGRGGVLLESKGTGTQQQFKNKYGEDVVSNGVIVRAANSTAALFGKNIYLRTGGADLGEGDILLDASKGKRRVQVYGKEFSVFCTKAVTFNYGPVDSSSTVNKVYYFGNKAMIADVQLLLGGKLIGYNGGGGKPGVIVDGGVYGTKSFATSGSMADKKGMFLGKVPGGFAGIISSACDAASQANASLKDAGQLLHQTTIVQKYYQTDQLGDDELVKLLKFSFRDPPSGSNQYRTAKFTMPEARWQQFVRFGLGSGGVGWTEKPVVYQGTETYPWPGKQKWVDEPTLLQLDRLTMFDAGQGKDKDRPGPYEQPQVGTLTPAVANGGYKLIR